MQVSAQSEAISAREDGKEKIEKRIVIDEPKLTLETEMGLIMEDGIEVEKLRYSL